MTSFIIGIIPFATLAGVLAAYSLARLLGCHRVAAQLLDLIS